MNQMLADVGNRFFDVFCASCQLLVLPALMMMVVMRTVMNMMVTLMMV